MAEDKDPPAEGGEKKDDANGGGATSGGSSKIFTIIALINTIAVLATGGILVYTKLLFKRPPITEAQERARLEKQKEKKLKDAKKAEPGMVTFDPITVNIRSTPGKVRTTESGDVEGKLHYATIGFALELKDKNKTSLIEELRPMFMDKLMSMLGRKSYTDLITVQGRFLVRTQIMDAVNDLILQDQAERAAIMAAKHKKAAAEKGEKAESEAAAGPESAEDPERSAESRDVLVTNIYFTHFVVQ